MDKFAYIFTISDEHVIRFLKFTIPNLIKVKIKQKIYVFVKRKEEKSFLDKHSNKFSELNVEIQIIDKESLINFDNVVNSKYNKMGYKTIMYSRLSVLNMVEEEYSFYSDIDVIFNKNPEKEIKEFYGNDFVGVVDEYYRMIFKVSMKKRKLYKEYFDLKNYFCSGTMFINNKKIIEAMKENTFIDFVRETDGQLMNDMQYINAVIQRSSVKSYIQKPRGAIARLHTKGIWTFKRPSISHFAGPVKQWDSKLKTYKRFIFRKTFNYIKQWNYKKSSGIAQIGKDIIFINETGKWSSVDFNQNNIVVYGNIKNEEKITRDLLFAREIIPSED